MAGARFHADREDGASAVEYAIMAALIAAVIVLVIVVLGSQTRASYCHVSETVAQVSGMTAASDDCA